MMLIPYFYKIIGTQKSSGIITMSPIECYLVQKYRANIMFPVYLMAWKDVLYFTFFFKSLWLLHEPLNILIFSRTKQKSVQDKLPAVIKKDSPFVHFGMQIPAPWNIFPQLICFHYFNTLFTRFSFLFATRLLRTNEDMEVKQVGMQLQLQPKPNRTCCQRS